MPFTPLIRINNGVREPPRKTIPKPRSRPPRDDDGTPIPEDQLTPERVPPPPPPPKPAPLYPKQDAAGLAKLFAGGLGEEDQLAMALAAQLMPDAPITTNALGAAPARGNVPFAGGRKKRLLLPETEHTPADIYETWMQQSAHPDVYSEGGYSLDIPRRRGQDL